MTPDDLTGDGSDRLLDQVVIRGGDDAVREGVDAHLRAGADHVAVQVLTAGPEPRLPRKEWRHLAEILQP
jgi:hypothetical protein